MAKDKIVPPALGKDKLSINSDKGPSLDSDKNNSTIVKMNAIGKDTSDDIADLSSSRGLRKFADISLRVLREQLWAMYDIVPNVTSDFGGNLMYHINKKWAKLEWQWPILLTITKWCAFNVRLNPSGKDLQEFYYLAEWLDTQALVQEMRNLKSFLTNETILPTSKFKKENFYGEETMDDFIADYEKDLKKDPVLKKV